jgi:hypothetical protein
MAKSALWRRNGVMASAYQRGENLKIVAMAKCENESQ